MSLREIEVNPGLEAKHINDEVTENLDEKTIVFSDKTKNFLDIANYVEGHVTEYSDEHTNKTTLKRVHIAIGNAKRKFLGIYHWFRGSGLQNYLNEFCYKLNRSTLVTGNLIDQPRQLHQACVSRRSNILINNCTRFCSF